MIIKIPTFLLGPGRGFQSGRRGLCKRGPGVHRSGVCMCPRGPNEAGAGVWAVSPSVCPQNAWHHLSLSLFMVEEGVGGPALGGASRSRHWGFWVPGLGLGTKGG